MALTFLIKLLVLIFLLLISEVYSKRPNINFNHYYIIENDLSQTHHSPLCSQTGHYAGWLLWLTVENWMTIKAKAVKRDTCCSLQPSEMTGQWGEWMVNSYLLCLCTLNRAFGASIINMQLQSLWECAGEVLGVYVFVWCVCMCVLACGSLLICVPWVSCGHSVPLCAEWERRREAHLDMRSQIIHLTLRQEGSTEHKRAKLKESEGGKERERNEREKKQTKRMNMNCKGAGESRPGRRESVSVWESEQERWRERENEGNTGSECYCAFLSGSQSDFIAHNLTMCSRGLSVPMMTIANL